MTQVPIMLILSLLTLVRLVAASSSLKIIHLNKDLNIRDLVVARQSSTGASTTVPSECESICDPVNAVLAVGCSVQDCCQSTFVTDYANCFECLGNAIGARNFTVAQQALNNLTMACDSAGVPVHSFSLPGPEASGAMFTITTIFSTQSTNTPAQATNTPVQATNTPAQATNTPAQATNTPVQATNTPAQATNAPAQSTNAPAQSTDSPAQSTNATSSAIQSCVIPHLSHVQASVVLLGGLIHLVL